MNTPATQQRPHDDERVTTNAELFILQPSTFIVILAPTTGNYQLTTGNSSRFHVGFGRFYVGFMSV
jgi:hypothetical protein